MRAAVIPGVRTRHAVVGELVADGRPRLPAVVGARQHLAEPAVALRHVDAIRIRGRSLHMVDLPAREMRTGDLPLLALAVGGENERALLRPDEDSDPAHDMLRWWKAENIRSDRSRPDRQSRLQRWALPQLSTDPEHVRDAEGQAAMLHIKASTIVGQRRRGVHRRAELDEQPIRRIDPRETE